MKEGKLRGSYQQAVRAANIIELFTPQVLNLFTMAAIPAAAPVSTPTATLAQCLRTGLAASQVRHHGLVSSAGQYNFQQGGNPKLKPETAKTYTFGLVLQPMPNLSATVDYWNFKLDNVITIVPSRLLLTIA